ncbi:MAG: acyl carrier protein [Actinomycetota bacterium]|nr:acyl carrier protein [Actinomycetota bacterium]
MRERVRSAVGAHLGIAADRLTDTALLGEELAVDSLAAIELAMALEEQFGVSLGEDVLSHVHTYGDLERAVLAAGPS